mgnify:CR=1 FL=1
MGKVLLLYLYQRRRGVVHGFLILGSDLGYPALHLAYILPHWLIVSIYERLIMDILLTANNPPALDRLVLLKVDNNYSPTALDSG